MINVSVCDRIKYDPHVAIDYVFEEEEAAFEFIKLSLSQGHTCLVTKSEE